MSGTLPADDHVFSFDLPLPDECDWLHAKKITPSLQLRRFFWAILVSLLIHLLFFQLHFFTQDVRPKVLPSKPIQISLVYVAQPKLPAMFEKQHVPQVDEMRMEPVVTSTELVNRTANQQKKEAKVSIIHQQNRDHETYLSPINEEPSSDLSSELSPQQDGEQNSNHFNDVFDPRLRARLQNNSAQKVSQRVSDYTDSTDLHGNTIVESDSGLCLKSVPTATGQPINWYMTTCAGRKSESEQMMERINNEVKRRH